MSDREQEVCLLFRADKCEKNQALKSKKIITFNNLAKNTLDATVQSKLL